MDGGEPEAPVHALEHSFLGGEFAERLSSARAELRSFHARSATMPVVEFLFTAGFHIVSMLVALSTLPILIRAAAALAVGFANARLFLIGHDAAHGSYTPAPRLNALIGRLALLGCFHSYSLWRSGHQAHHRYTNLRGRDFVWTPLSKREYERLGPLGRACQRMYRNDLGLGLGLYYMLEIWLPRMLFPRDASIGKPRTTYWLDTGLLIAFAFALTGISLWFATLGGHLGDPVHWLFTAIFAFVIPLLIVHWLIGLVVFFNHTHPDIPWFRDESEWSYWQAQVECTAHQQSGFLTRFLLPDEVMKHTAHHVDQRIPVHRLPDAQTGLEKHLGGNIVRFRWGWHEYSWILRCCKLYDYQTHRWLDFAGMPTNRTTKSK